MLRVDYKGLVKHLDFTLEHGVKLLRSVSQGNDMSRIVRGGEMATV